MESTVKLEKGLEDRICSLSKQVANQHCVLLQPQPLQLQKQEKQKVSEDPQMSMIQRSGKGKERRGALVKPHSPILHCSAAGPSGAGSPLGGRGSIFPLP